MLPAKYKPNPPGGSGLEKKSSEWFLPYMGVTGRFGPIPVRTPGRFGPIPFRSGRFGLGRFGPILEVGRFDPVLVGRFGPLYFIYFSGNKFFLLARLM